MLVTRNSPRASVYTVIGAPGPFTITDTPGSTPPCSSTTFPKMPPVDCPYCAITALGRTIAHTNRAIADTIHGNRFGIDPPFNSLALLDPRAGGSDSNTAATESLRIAEDEGGIRRDDRRRARDSRGKRL